MLSQAELEKAVAAAKAGDWHQAHEIAQSYSDPVANWLHAILHKIEGDAWNSKYWYARTHGIQYEDYPELTEEFSAILSSKKSPN
jgi:hypothetical protein